MRTPYLDMVDVSQRYRIRDKSGVPSASAALQLIDRLKVRTKKLGRKVLVHEDDLEAKLKDRT